MDDEVVDGEIRSPILNSPVPEKDTRPPLKPPSEPITEKSLDNERSGLDEPRGLFGEYEKSDPVGQNELHGESFSQHEVINMSMDTENVAAAYCGPHIVGDSGSNVEVHLDKEGPTPTIGLGKRSRDNRSPPSSGSMQGPPVKCFYQDPEPGGSGSWYECGVGISDP
ncbi:hypothetical protein Hanom_Chr08g00755331 [Helianthus anomalus]